MSKTREYVPYNLAQYNAFMDNLTKYVVKNMTKWKTIPTEGFQPVLDAFAAFQDVYLPLAAHPMNAAQRERIREAQAACTAVLRPFVNQWLRFPPVNNADRIEMGIPNHDAVRTDHKVVVEMVDYVVHLRNIRELLVDFWIQGQTHKAKPEGYDGAVIIWGILDSPPRQAIDLDHHAMASRTPFVIHFEEAERGKTVWIAAAWQNERVILGQWSEFKSAVIP